MHSQPQWVDMFHSKVHPKASTLPFALMLKMVLANQKEILMQLMLLTPMLQHFQHIEA